MDTRDTGDFEDLVHSILASVAYLAREKPDTLQDLDFAPVVLDLAGASIRTYADAGVLAGDTGLVVRLANGAEFRLPIHQAAYPKPAPKPEPITSVVERILGGPDPWATTTREGEAVESHQ